MGLGLGLGLGLDRVQGYHGRVRERAAERAAEREQAELAAAQPPLARDGLLSHRAEDTRSAQCGGERVPTRARVELGRLVMVRVRVRVRAWVRGRVRVGVGVRVRK